MVLRAASLRYMERTKSKLCSMKASSKQWWKIANGLLTKKVGVSSVPPLKNSDGAWARDGKSKANLISETLASKSVLPVLTENIFTPADVDDAVLSEIDVIVTEADASCVMSELDESSGTGPDKLAARVLKQCRSVLAAPIARLCSRILAFGQWPDSWRLHWIHPIHKRGSRANASNYRGVHLTPQVSKVCERILGKILRPWLDFGDRQFAYTPGRGHRDALLLNIMEWILWLEDGYQIGLYDSDVSGAFDKVDHILLCRKLRATGMPKKLYQVLASWLDDRLSQVATEGLSSDPRALLDSVFQGTVLGPPLWNLFFKDSNRSLTDGFVDTTYADDKNAFKKFSRTTPHDAIMADLRGCQASLHQ